MKRDLVDEYRVGLNPLVLGGGNPLFKPSDTGTRLQLLEARSTTSGVVILRYGAAGG
jgi:dihydrofolate reductase